MTDNTNSAVAKTKRSASPLIGLAQKFNIEPDKLLDVLKGTVIKPDSNDKPASNEEVAAFCIVAQQYGLNPFTREIHAFTKGGSVVPIVGIDGWTHIVNARGEFDGCEFVEVDGKDGKPDRITCRMHVKGRAHPVEATERYSECYRPTTPWKTMPYRMLRHKAYIQAARYAFGLSGIYDEDEGLDIIKNTKAVVKRDPIKMPEAINVECEMVEGAPPIITSESPPAAPVGETWICQGCGVENTEPAEKRDPEYCYGCGLFRGEDPEAGHYFEIQKGDLFHKDGE